MTIDESINILEDGDWWEELGEWYIDVNIEYDRLHEAVDMAIAALKEKKKAEKNKPLTKEELDKMGTGPIYVVPKDPQLVKKGWKDWCVWDSKEKKAFVPGIAYKAWDIEDYGEEWIAYLIKGENVEKSKVVFL